MRVQRQLFFPPGDNTLHLLFGLKRLPTDDTIPNWLTRFDQNKVGVFFGNLTHVSIGSGWVIHDRLFPLLPISLSAKFGLT